MIAGVVVMIRSLRTRLLAAALLLPLVALATATSGHWLRCSVTGVEMAACCCDGQDATTQAPPTTTVSQGDCCDRVERNVAPTVAELTLAETGAPPAAIVALPREGTSNELVSAPTPVRARTSLGPPTSRLRLIAKSTLLI
jgi:hypothetical protein